MDVDGSISSLDFSPCGTKIAAACNDYNNDNYTVKILGSSSESAGTFECESTLRVDAGYDGVRSVSFSPKDNVIAAGCSNGKIYLVDALAGAVKSTLTGHSDE